MIGWSVRVFKYVRAQEETILGLRYFISGLLSGTKVHTHFFLQKAYSEKCFASVAAFAIVVATLIG